MLHISTRGMAPAVDFRDAMLTGLAADGGLYWPAAFKGLTKQDIDALSGQSYAEIAIRILKNLTDGEWSEAELAPMVREAYGTFQHKAVAPLMQIDDNLFVLELFHGPTLAFKDIAMQLLARLMASELRRRGQTATIVGATSGDTGSAAIEAFKGLPGIDVFILYPHGRVSDVQRRQMTSVGADNVHALAIEGTFDDCQALVKAMFAHKAFRESLSLSGVNSINWARIAAQVVYYFSAAVSLGAPHRAINFAVPTGNFGNVLAGYVASKMGLPIGSLIVGTNANDVLARMMARGEAELAEVVPTSSPSMDIQVSSNVERLIFDACAGEAQEVRQVMDHLAQARAYRLTPLMRKFIGERFAAAPVSEVETRETIARVWRQSGYMLDPHTAVGVRAAERLGGEAGSPLVALGTAHPAKFPDVVAAATGMRPNLPRHLADLAHRKERIVRLPNELGAVEAFITHHASASGRSAA